MFIPFSRIHTDEVLHGWKIVLQSPIITMESDQKTQNSQEESKHLVSIISSSCVKIPAGTKQCATKKNGGNMVDTYLPRTIIVSKIEGKVRSTPLDEAVNGMAFSYYMTVSR